MYHPLPPDALVLNERAPLQEALARSGYRRLRLRPELEAAYTHNRRAVAVAHIQAHWLLVLLAVAVISAFMFGTGLVAPRMQGLAMLGIATVVAVTLLVGVAARVPALQARIDLVVGIAAYVVLGGMQVGAAVGDGGDIMRAVAEYGVIFVTIALFTISGLSVYQSLFVGCAVFFSLVIGAALSDALQSVYVLLGSPRWLAPLADGFAPDGQRFAFYGGGSLLIGALTGVAYEIRERTVFLQATLLQLEKRELDQLTGELTLISRQDALTGLANRRHFDEVFAREWSACQREGTAMNLLFIDVDYFKRYNDHYGHQAGDDCLARVAGALAVQAKRGPDFVARYGGEEFVAFFPRTNAAGLQAIANRMVEAVDSLAIPHAASDAASHVTISVGVAAITPMPGQSAEALVQAADAALYRAKEAGRHGCVVAWDS